MAREKLPKGQARLSDPPSRVSITVTVGATDPARRMRDIRARLARPPWSLSAVVAPTAVMTCAAVAAVLLQSSRTHAVARPSVDGAWRLVLDEGQLFVPNALLSPVGADSIRAGAVSGYPLGCVGVAVALHDPRFRRADFDRRFRCADRHN